MIITILFIVFGILALVLLFYFAGRRRLEIAGYPSLIEHLERVPVGALLNLLDPVQQSYLERTLPNHQQARLRRLRNRVLLRYFRAIHKNAGIFLRCAHAATQSERREIAEAGRELRELAMFTRVRSLHAMFLLSLAVVVPTPITTLLPIVTKYASAISRSTEVATALSKVPVSA